MEYLDQKLISYSKTDIYPFHMPGHKRQELDFPNPYTIDITEIDGFDNLHHAEEILREAQERAAKLYGSDHCYYLVNGSTCGLLAAICAATKKGDRVLVARNSHKVVYHALFLNELNAEYLYPAITRNDLQGQITPEQVEEALQKNSNAAAVIVTSPTYEGIVSDVAGIAKVCHVRNIPLIVDEAHGAHLGFEAGFPENAVRLGADAVIMSLHKTLPSFTQTALLHISGTRINTETVERYLGIFQTSSPSYLFMAGMDACIRGVSENGAKLFTDYRKRLDDFYKKTNDLKYLHVMNRKDLRASEAFAWDDSKIVIFAEIQEKNENDADRETIRDLAEPIRGYLVSTGESVKKKTNRLTGEQLHRILLEKYHLQMEMVSASYVLGMTSIMDTDEGFDRLAAALHDIDSIIGKKSQKLLAFRSKAVKAVSFSKNHCTMQMHEAMTLPYREVLFSEAAGNVSADYVYLYPPGIPLIIPGEVITGEFWKNWRNADWRGSP